MKIKLHTLLHRPFLLYVYMYVCTSALGREELGFGVLLNLFPWAEGSLCGQRLSSLHRTEQESQKCLTWALLPPVLHKPLSPWEPPPHKTSICGCN